MAEQIEATLDDLKTKLEDGLPAAIAAENAAISDGYALDGAAIVAVGGREVHDYPQVFVLPDRTDKEFDTGSSVVWLHRVRVVSFIADWDQEALARKLIRYQRVVRELCMQNRRPGEALGSSGGWGIEFDSEEFGPVFQPTDTNTGAEMPFVAGAATIFIVRQQQTLT